MDNKPPTKQNIFRSIASLFDLLVLHETVSRHMLKEGDIVLIVEPNASRGESPLACVIEAYPGNNGLVRVVKIKMKNKEYLRPVHRLCALEYVEDNAEE